MKNNFLIAEDIERRIGYVFNNKDLVILACVHSSYWNENQQELASSNERLEFLGDSVLNLIVAEFLYLRFPNLSEGKLSDMRSNIVEAQSCYEFAKKLNLEEALLLGRGEKKPRESIVADFFEALLGAIYLDGGLKAVQEFFFHHFQEEVDKIIEKPSRNFKAELQEYVQKRYPEPPFYEVVDEWGLAHEKQFRIAVFVNKEKIAEGEGSSKKIAQQHAAASALSLLLAE